MQNLTYYVNRYPYPKANDRLTLAGLMRAFLDGIHGLLDMQKGGIVLNGGLAQQATLTYSLNSIADIGANARFAANGIPIDAGQTIASLVILYQREARTLFAAYR